VPTFGRCRRPILTSGRRVRGAVATAPCDPLLDVSLTQPLRVVVCRCRRRWRWADYSRLFLSQMRCVCSYLGVKLGILGNFGNFWPKVGSKNKCKDCSHCDYITFLRKFEAEFHDFSIYGQGLSLLIYMDGRHCGGRWLEPIITCFSYLLLPGLFYIIMWVGDIFRTLSFPHSFLLRSKLVCAKTVLPYAINLHVPTALKVKWGWWHYSGCLLSVILVQYMLYRANSRAKL